MKAFAFRLEQALRWRETQARLQKARLAVAVGRLAEIEHTLNTCRSELAAAASQVAGGPTGIALDVYAGFRKRSSERIRESETQLVAARKTVTLETERLLEANRKLRSMENLKRNAQSRWTTEFDRELAAFADEAFLHAVHANRARSG